MDKKHRLGFSWLAVVLCMALLMTGMPLTPAYAKAKGKTVRKETYYTIKWKVNGETVKKDKVKKGEKPEKPRDPDDYSDGKYTYVFSGWEPKVAKATQDMTYNARFKKTDRKFKITWLDDKGKKIDVTEVKYGKLPTHEDPKKKASAKYTYTFDGWDPEPVKAKADATYTATFKKATRKYTITWVDDKGNTIDKTKVAYGKLPTHDDPVKKSKKYTYIFTGWKPALEKVTGDATYTATFSKAEQFTVTWLDDEGNVIDTTKVNKGEKPTHDDPVKAATEQYTYTFAGWSPKPVKAKADATYTATFKKKTRKYTVTWLDDQGNVIDQTQVAYGKLPTHDDPAREDADGYSYVFKGWDPKPVEVTGDAEYTAVFEKVPKGGEPTGAPSVYTIAWLDDEGNLIDTTTVAPGEVPAHDAPQKADTKKYTYTFEGWSPAPVAATADADYTAVFGKAVRSYTVTWLDDAGETIDTTQVAYGKLPVHDDPVKAATDKATYTFAGWKPELEKVTGDAAYTATFTETLTDTGETDPEIVDPDLAVGNSVEILFKYAQTDELIDYPQQYVETDEPIQVYYEGTEPELAETDDSAYEWIGWTDDKAKPDVAIYGKSRTKDEKPLLPVVTKDTPAETVYYAVFKSITKYTVTWVIDDATETTRVAEGRRPTHDDPAKQGFVFDGWLDKDGKLYKASELPSVTADATYTAQFTANVEAYDITWVIDGEEEVTQFEAGVKPTHDDPKPGQEGYAFAGWADEAGKLYAAGDLPVVTAAATYTARWQKAVTLEDVNCYAYVKSKEDRKTLKTLLPAEMTLDDGSVLKLDWTDASPDYVDSNDGVKNDGRYTYMMSLTEKADPNKMLDVTCTVVVGPKQSETVGAKKETKNKDYTYRWDDFDAKKAGAIITGWTGSETALTVASYVDGMAVTAIGKGAFQNNKKLTAVTVPAGVTAVEKGAFANCASLSALTLPDSLTSIGMDIAEDSDALATMTLSVALETTMGSDGSCYTISHVLDEADAGKPVMSQTVTLPDGFPTDIAIAAPGELKLTEDFVVKRGHQVSDAALVTEDGGRLLAEITWLDDAGTKIDSTEVAYGDVPTHGKPADKTVGGAVYTFKEWKPSPDAVTGPTSYTAVYEQQSYMVTFVDEDGTTVLLKAPYKAGDTPLYSGDVPAKAADTRYTYAFAGWVDTADTKTEPTVYPSGGLPAVTADVTYRATYTAAERMYTVTFVNDDEAATELDRAEFKYEATPVYSGQTPAKEDAQYTYAFAGWVDTADTKKNPTVYASDQLPKVTADVTYRASYTSTERLYTVTFVDEDGATELWKKEDYKYNETPVYGGTAPAKASDEKHYYAFEGWVGSDEKLHKLGEDLPAVTANETYKARYKEGTPVALVAKYTGDGLTKVYDCNRYGAYMKDNQVVYIIEALKTIKNQFKLDLSKKAKWVDGHKNVGFKLSLSKQFDSADVGSYQFEFKVTLTGDDALYYTLPEPVIKVPATITPREVVVTPRAGLSKAYGTADPKYPEGSWLSNDETSPLHQDLSGVAGYGVPVNTVDGKLSLSVTNAAYLLQEAKLKGTRFFPGENPWLIRQEGEDVGKYKIMLGGMDFGKNFTVKLKDEVFTINAKNIADANVTVNAISSQQYTGKPITLDKDKLVVRYGAMTLVEDKDFTTEYANNTEPSTGDKLATVTLTGKGNFTGARKVTFTIIKTASPTATPGGGGGSYGGGSHYGGGSSSFGYGYDGFSGDDPEGDSDGEDDDDEDDSESWTPASEGNLIVKEMDYGAVEFTAKGTPHAYSYQEGEVMTENDEGDEVPVYRVVIRPEAMKATNDEGVEEELLLEDSARKRYDELHLRLTDSIVQGLINNGVGEIVYELEQARLVIPLSALASTIVLPADEEDEDADGSDIEDELEFEGDFDMDGAEEFDDIEMDDADIAVEDQANARTLPVDGYDIVIEQADATGLSPRETQLIGDNGTLMPAYRVRVSIIPEDAPQVPTGEVDENGQAITVPATEPLPEGYTLPGVLLQLQPDESYDMGPEEAQVLYVSTELAMAGEAELPEEDDEALAEDEEAFDEDGEAADEDEESFDEDEEDVGEEDEAFEDDDEFEDDVEDADFGEAMVENNPVLADAIDDGQATLTPAMFNELETPIVVEIDDVEDGLYVALVPPDWDPTPYLSQEDEEDSTSDDDDDDEYEEDDFEYVDDDEDEELELDEAGDDEVIFEDGFDDESIEI